MILLITGPSGAGKSSFIGRLMDQDPRLAFSISTTTRPIRAGERDGRPLARVPEKPQGRFGRPLFQGMSYGDTPERPVRRAGDRRPPVAVRDGAAHPFQAIAEPDVALERVVREPLDGDPAAADRGRGEEITGRRGVRRRLERVGDRLASQVVAWRASLLRRALLLHRVRLRAARCPPDRASARPAPPPSRSGRRAGLRRPRSGSRFQPAGCDPRR